jgi:hypothetical protein
MRWKMTLLLNSTLSVYPLVIRRPLRTKWTGTPLAPGLENGAVAVLRNVWSLTDC